VLRVCSNPGPTVGLSSLLQRRVSRQLPTARRRYLFPNLRLCTRRIRSLELAGFRDQSGLFLQAPVQFCGKRLSKESARTSSVIWSAKVASACAVVLVGSLKSANGVVCSLRFSKRDFGTTDRKNENACGPDRKISERFARAFVPHSFRFLTHELSGSHNIRNVSRRVLARSRQTLHLKGSLLLQAKGYTSTAAVTILLLRPQATETQSDGARPARSRMRRKTMSVQRTVAPRIAETLRLLPPYARRGNVSSSSSSGPPVSVTGPSSPISTVSE